MFKSKGQRNHEQTLAAIGLVGALVNLAGNSKGRGAERLEAMAQVVAGLGFDPESIQSVEIKWESIRVGGSYELVPVLKMISVGGEVEELKQIERMNEER